MHVDNNTLIIKLHFVSSIKVKPFFLKKKIKTNTLYANVFIKYIYTILFFFNKKNKIPLKIIFFHTPKKNYSFNILRAPYKNKIAQNSYSWSRYRYVIILQFYNYTVVDYALLKNLVQGTQVSFNSNVSNLRKIQFFGSFNFEL